MSATPSSIKITALADIGNAISYTTLFPVVSMQGTPTTDKANLQIIGNIILNGAGGSYFPAAAQSLLALSVANAAQPNITSVGTLTRLSVLGNISAGNTNGGNIVNANFYYGSGQFLTNLNIANVVGLGNIATINLNGNVHQVLSGNGSWVPAGSNTGNINFNGDVIYSNTGVVVNNSDLGNGQTAGLSIPTQGGGNPVMLFNAYGNVDLLAGNIGNTQNVQAWNFGADGNLTLPDGTILQKTGGIEFPASEFEWDLHSSDGNVYIGALTGSMAYIDTYSPDISVRLRTTGTDQNDWLFGPDGNLTLPDIANPSINYANGQPYGGGGNANTGNITFSGTTMSGPTGSADNYSVYIKPSGDFINTLQIYPTADHDIHLFESTGNAITLGSYGESQVSVNGPNSPNANITIQSNGNTWTFGEDGSLQVPANFANPSPGTIAAANGYPTLLAYGSGFHGGPELDWMNADDPANNFGNVNVLRNTMYLNGTGFYIGINENGVVGNAAPNWSFNPNGSTIFPTLTVQRGDNPSGTITGQTLLFGDNSQEAIISTPDGTVSNENSQRLVINPGQGYDYGEGGDIYLWAGRGGDGSGTGGDIKIRGGQGGANTTGGSGGDGGYIRIEAGDSATTGGDPGYIDINAGINYLGTGGYVDIRGGQGHTIGGDTNITGGYGYNVRGGNVNIWGGGSANGQINEGYVNIQTGGKTWEFDSGGNLTAPGNLDVNGNVITLGPGASEIAANIGNPTLVISNTGDTFIQAVITNVSDIGSADWVAQGHHGDDNGGWVDMGFTSSFYNDPNYTITGPGDGYVITQAYPQGQAPATGGGNLVLATGIEGTTKDIIFGTGGFLTANIFGRISDANNALELSRTGSNIDLVGGGNISNANVISANSFVGDGSQLTSVATQETGSWTLATGTNTVNLSVPLNGTYSIWVRGNIPNGIITYTATAVVTNNNVPVLGSSYGWYYALPGNALVLTAIPTQFVGTVNNISNAVVSTTTANVFTFGITNNSGNAAVVNWGYTKL